MELFNIIDTKQDGYIDETEFSGIFKGIAGAWNSHEFEILDSVMRDKGNAMKGAVDIAEAANTTVKTVHTKNDLFGYPHFSTVNMRQNSARPKTSKNRTLSIIDKDGISVSSYNQKPSSRNSNIQSEYQDNFKKSNSIHSRHSRITSAYAQSAKTTSSGWTRDTIRKPQQPDKFIELI